MQRLMVVLAALVLFILSFSITPVMAQTSTTTIPMPPGKGWCEGNFDCDRDVDGTDAFNLKADFGRHIVTWGFLLSLHSLSYDLRSQKAFCSSFK